jgi:integrase
MRYAIATGRASRNIADDLRGTLPPVKGGHHAAITSPKELGALYKAIEEYQGSIVTRCAIKLQVLLFLRPTELRTLEWSDIADDIISIPAERMKMKEPHLVPLSKQAVTALNQLRPAAGISKYVFPSQLSKQRPMSENTVNTALRRMGYSKEEVTGHGFRATARTILDEVLKVRVDLIEHQLAHAVKDTNGRAYNRTTHIEDRTVMMQQWADYLESL